MNTNDNVLWFYDNKDDYSNKHNDKIENESEIPYKGKIKENDDNDNESTNSWDEDSMLLSDIKCEVVIDEYSTNALNEERHNNTSIKSINDNNVSCVPDIEEERNQSMLTANKNTISQDKPYTCVICNKRFSSKHHVRRHMTIHSEETPFACDQCPFKGKQQLYLKKHMKIHTGEKPFSCNVCPYRGAQRTHLINHLRTHTGEKPYACKYCAYRCATQSDIKRHTRIHTGEKPYSCQFCTYRSRAKNVITKHEITCNVKL